VRAGWAALALCCVAAPAFAKSSGPIGGGSIGFSERPGRHFESPQWFALELKFTPYTPQIDSSPGLRGTPFADLFTPQSENGEPPNRLLTQVEFDVQFLKKVGTLGVGVSIGFYRRTTHAFKFSDSLAMTSCTVGKCERSGDETALNILPIEVMLVYRFDWLMKRYRVPFVPYLKVGLAYYLWFIQNGSDGIASYQDPNDPNAPREEGMGGTWGFGIHPGLAFQLDVIDQAAARVVDAEIGINHTYLFIELNYSDISNFGRDRTLVLSDLTFNTGLSFEF